MSPQCDRDKLRWQRDRRFAGLEPDVVKGGTGAKLGGSASVHAQAAKVDLAKLGPRKSAGEKVLLAMAMKAATSVSNGRLAERPGMGLPASVGQFVRRGLADEEARRRLEALYLGCVWEINQPIAEALRAREIGHWAGVDLGGMARWATSTSFALAERPPPFALARFISQTHPKV